ncbi:MAG: MCE family protein [Acidobacteria bacterium]|nr:MCE family protein [Acidobacteriota bacterium]MBV9481797.1 MCE family protein [Acidobacteriota bacterium]
MPSQKQLRWSQLKVGITVLCALTFLAVMSFKIGGTSGLFTSKILLLSYFDNASGLRIGAPVRLQGVDIGNVAGIRVVTNKPLTPVEVAMKVNTRYLSSLRSDSVTSLETAGVLGETFVEIDSSQAHGPAVQTGAVLATREHPDFQDVVRSSQSTLQNMDALLKRLDRIVAFVESGQGSIGKLIYDTTLYARLNATLNEFQTVVSDVSQGKGSIGKLVASDELYNKASASVDQLNRILDDIQQGKGSFGKFLKDPTLYDNANQTVANVHQMIEDLNSGKGALGKLTRDQAFAAKLENTMDRISAITEALQAGQGTMGMLLKNPSVYQNSDQMLTETRALVKAIRENPKRYLTFRVKVF